MLISTHDLREALTDARLGTWRAVAKYNYARQRDLNGNKITCLAVTFYSGEDEKEFNFREAIGEVLGESQAAVHVAVETGPAVKRRLCFIGLSVDGVWDDSFEPAEA